jgi:DNA modification methylase
MADVAVLNQTATNRFIIYNADCVEAVAGLPERSVGYSIFSPPFSSLFTYSNSPRDMSNCRGDGGFYAHFKFLIRDLLRVTIPGRLLSFHVMNLTSGKARDGFIGLRDFRGELIRLFVEAGWIYHSEVCIWKDPVCAMQRTKALGLLHKTVRGNSSMARQGLADYLVTMRKPGDVAQDDRVKHDSADYPVAKWQHVASPIWTDIVPSDTLQRTSAREDKDEQHICPLQLKVIRRAVELWTNPDDVVLSPFMGIGSEGYVSVQLGRKFVGVELKESYYKQAVANIRRIHAETSRRGR